VGASNVTDGTDSKSRQNRTLCSLRATMLSRKQRDRAMPKRWSSTGCRRDPLRRSPIGKHPRFLLALVRPNGLNDNPTYKIDIDREKASAFGINLSDVDQTFSIAWGSRYVNNFLDTDGRIKKVYVQADVPYRMNPEDLKSLYVRNTKGSMVPFTSFANGSWSYGSPKLERYNGVSSVEIQGQAAPGKSTGQAMTEMQNLMQKLPAGIGYEWTGVSLQEQQSGSRAQRWQWRVK
jgi:multidrug efflux pump subunit AcrB